MSAYDVQLLGGFQVTTDGRGVVLPHDCQRVVAFLGTHELSLPRSLVAGRLWPDSSDGRALGCLRTALWRLRRLAPDVVAADTCSLVLAEETRTDVRAVADRAERIRQRRPVERPLDHHPFVHELLPGWYDDWVVPERERLRQLCVHTLESIAAGLAERRDYGAAIQALLGSIAFDELREAPHRQLMAIHLAEGNPSEAIRVYNEYSSILRRDLGIAPSQQMTALLR